MNGNARSRRRIAPAGAEHARVVFACPLCGARVSSSNVEAHLAKKHAETTQEQFRAALDAGLRSGAVRFELSGKTFHAVSGTELLLRERKTSKAGVRSVVQGGSPGLKKTRT